MFNKISFINKNKKDSFDFSNDINERELKIYMRDSFSLKPFLNYINNSNMYRGKNDISFEIDDYFKELETLVIKVKRKNNKIDVVKTFYFNNVFNYGV